MTTPDAAADQRVVVDDQEGEERQRQARGDRRDQVVPGSQRTAAGEEERHRERARGHQADHGQRPDPGRLRAEVQVRVGAGDRVGRGQQRRPARLDARRDVGRPERGCVRPSAAGGRTPSRPNAIR